LKQSYFLWKFKCKKILVNKFSFFYTCLIHWDFWPLGSRHGRFIINPNHNSKPTLKPTTKPYPNPKTNPKPKPLSHLRTDAADRSGWSTDEILRKEYGDSTEFFLHQPKLAERVRSQYGGPSG